MRKAILIAMLAISAVACNNKANEETTKTEALKPKCLVLYYSQTGVTKAVAEALQGKLGCDIEAIEIEEPYDGDFEATVRRSSAEREAGILPTMIPLQSNIADYDVIFLGYPIWYGTYAPPIMSLLQSHDFADKTIVPFCTFGSGGLESSLADLKLALPKAKIAEGYGVRTARLGAMPTELERFMKANKYLEGEVETLPDYSEQTPVTETETALFDAACGDYEFPLGTPITFGKRVTANSTDYKYVVMTQDRDGKACEATVFVTVIGDKAEFTRVVR